MDISKLYDLYLQHPLVCNDTRKITQGCIYWALKGERFDGNDFIPDALQKGAVLAVTDSEEFASHPQCFYTEDSLKALQNLAKEHIKNLKIQVIAIGGSNGKTTTKELTQRVLSARQKTFATPGNFNNHIGLPLSILMLTKEHHIAVLELGANHLHETEFLCSIAMPDFGIITNIGKDHLEGFGGIEGVERANAELFDFLRENNGAAFINTDDEAVMRHAGGMQKITYGTNPDADFSGIITGRFPFLSVEVSDVKKGEKVQINSHLFGSFHLYNILAAAAIGKQFGVSLEESKAAIESYIPANNRSQVIQRGTTTYIMDAYNANPSSMQGALKDFMDYPATKKIVLLGEMLELGEDTKAEHIAILDLLSSRDFSEIILVGKSFYELKEKLTAHYFMTIEEAKEWFWKTERNNFTLLMKGSRGCRLEKLVE